MQNPWGNWAGLIYFPLFLCIPQIFPKVCFLLVFGWNLRYRTRRSSLSGGGDRNANRLHPRDSGREQSPLKCEELREASQRLKWVTWTLRRRQVGGKYCETL